MSSETKTCLVVVFNHPHEPNLPILEKIYRSRFPYIRYLMPFYQGEHKDVVAVHHSSYTFQGYFAEAFARLYETACDYYVIVADDLLLRPDLTSSNLSHEFALRANSSYIKNLAYLANAPVGWPHRIPALRAFKPNSFVKFDGNLPKYDEVARCWDRLGLGLPLTPSRWVLLRDLFSRAGSSRPAVWLDNMLYWLQHTGLTTSRISTFPLLYAYSDLVIVSASAMPRFCALCGLFAAMGLFVEVAIPTALAICAEHICTEASLARKGREFWKQAEIDRWLAEHSNRLDRIIDNWPADCLYVHPVKLSLLATPYTSHDRM